MTDTDESGLSEHDKATVLTAAMTVAHLLRSLGEPLLAGHAMGMAMGAILAEVDNVSTEAEARAALAAVVEYAVVNWRSFKAGGH